MSSPSPETITPVSVDAIAFDLLSALESAVHLFERFAVVGPLGQMRHTNTLNTLRKISTIGSYVPFELVVQTNAAETDRSVRPRRS